MSSWVYENGFENTVRYVLGKKGNKPLVCFGINPSTAEPGKLDNTLKSVERLAMNNGFDSWIMLNIYPQRSTNPDEIHLEPDYLLHERNLFHIDNVLKNLQQPVIWAAWGTLIEKRRYFIDFLEDIYKKVSKYNCTWISIGKRSKNGHPHHPLYLSSDSKPEEFDIAGYIEKIGMKKGER